MPKLQRDNYMKPISPKDFQKSYGSNIPDGVIEVVNEIIKSKATYEGATQLYIKKSEVVNALVAKGFDKSTIYKEHMLDFEPNFRKEGWEVIWNKGAYYEDEDYDHWVFSF